MTDHALRHQYVTPEPTGNETWYCAFESRIIREFGGTCSDRARSLAYQWARGVGDSLGLRSWRTWKEFKRAVAAIWFGEPERCVFPPGWHVNEVMRYTARFPQRRVRATTFAQDVACHAPSTLLPRREAEQRHTLERLDRALVLEVFPESSCPSSICFRRYGDSFGAEVVYEAGLGQAMYAFEAEQGLHTLVSANISRDKEPTWGCSHGRGADRTDEKVISAKLRNLIGGWGWSLEAAVFGMCRKLGMEWVALEGYFDESGVSPLTIVDLDMPFDVAFMGSVERRGSGRDPQVSTVAASALQP